MILLPKAHDKNIVDLILEMESKIFNLEKKSFKSISTGPHIILYVQATLKVILKKKNLLSFS